MAVAVMRSMAFGSLLICLLLIAACMTSVQGCDAQVDMVLILDSSGSVTLSHYNETKEFLRDLVDTLNVSCNGIRVGMEIFSNQHELRFHLNEHYNREDVKQNIMASEYRRGGTNTADALEYCRETMFTVEHGDRCGVPNVAILLTDGKSSNSEDTFKQAGLCREKGIEIFAVGVGGGVDMNEINTVASDPDHVFQVEFSELEQIKMTLRRKACGLIKPSTPSHNCSDMDFLPEEGQITCVCATSDLGYPPSRLQWRLGETIVASGDEEQKVLPLPSDFLKRGYDRTRLVCQTDWEDDPEFVELPLNIAYGPDNVEIRAFHHYDESHDLSFVFRCDVTGLNPSDAEMVVWRGPCQGQEGFTCVLDPDETDVRGKDVTCQVTNRYNNDAMMAATTRITTVKPSTPTHNCKEVDYIAETDQVTCTCSTEDLGYPEGHLTWRLQDRSEPVARSTSGTRQLVLPPNLLRRDLDRTQAICELSGPEPLSVALPLNIAYGPDTVQIQTSHHYDDSYRLTFLFRCDATGLNPRTPDMVEWGGLCQGQTGFTCSLDADRTDVKGKSVTCRVTNSYNRGLSREASTKIQPVKPSPPTHNCTDVGYISETGGVTCTCSTDDLGDPPGYLTWRLQGRPDPVATSGNGVRQLVLPRGYLTKDRDRIQAICELVWLERQSVVLPLNVAYGPETVDVRVYQPHTSMNRLLHTQFVIHCEVSGLNPQSPDMVQWGGPCKGQTGFTCTVDSCDSKVLGELVTCRVTNPFNGGRSVEGAKQVDQVTQCLATTAPSDCLNHEQRVWMWVAVGALVVLAIVACLLIFVILLKRRPTKEKTPPNSPVPARAVHQPNSNWPYRRY